MPDRHLRGCAEFPRPLGRGLIEAGISTQLKSRRSRFHDRLVVASLKPGGLAYLTPNGLFPRPLGRGLIEASSARQSQATAPGFHDRLVVASLKQARCHHLRIAVLAGFHDRLVVASLKRRPLCCQTTDYSCFHDRLVVASLKRHKPIPRVWVLRAVSTTAWSWPH